MAAPAHEVWNGAATAAVARDRGGAQFGLLQHATFFGAELVNTSGSLVWADGYTDEPAANQAFYGQLLELSVRRLPEGGAQFATLGAPDEQAVYCGITGRRQGLAPYWAVYFGTDDVDAAVARCVGNGGVVADGAQDTPWGRIARLTDPAGAEFAVMTPDWSLLPDRSG